MKIVRIIVNAVLLVALVGMGIVASVSFFSAPNGKGLMNYKGYTVVSGSMEPAISAGDFVFVKMDPFEEIQPDDRITFQTSDHIVVTHRVKEKQSEALITKGDANQTIDGEPVTPDRLIGRVHLVIPYLGSVLLFLKRPIVVVVLAGIILIWLLLAYYFSDKNEVNTKEVE